MKKCIYSLLIGIVTYSNFAMAEFIHMDCTDQTFAYNRMTVIDNDEKIKLNVMGSTVFKLSPGEWEDVSISTIFSIAKDHCVFSEDKKLFTCHVNNLNVAKGLISREMLNVSNFYLSLKFVESAPENSSKSGFELSTSYKYNDVYISNRTLFLGNRESGCF